MLKTSAIVMNKFRIEKKLNKYKVINTAKQKTIPIFKYSENKGSKRLYVWGLQEHGALGTQKKLSFGQNRIAFCGIPHRLLFREFKDVYDVACGYGFTVFAIKSNRQKIVYGTGINSDSQLGFYPNDENIKIPIIYEPRKIILPFKSENCNVIGLAAGRAHSLILTDEGIYTLGNNAYGQCGRPIIPNENYAKSNVVHYIPCIDGIKIISVTAGQDHSLFLNEKGQVYSFGWGADGQTGLGHYRNQYKPELVRGDITGQNIVKVACAADCVLALSDKGKLFGWGNSEYSQLPVLNNNQQVNIPTEIKMFENCGNIIDIACGGSFCMILNNDGEVYVWGYGILGLGPTVERTLTPHLIPKTLFGSNAYEPDSKIVKIFCGISQLGAINNYGHLYMWGRNKFGALGLGHTNDQYFPFKVSVGAEVQKVSCGVDHVVSICKPFIK